MALSNPLRAIPFASYSRLWRGLPLDLAYVLTTFPIVVTTFAVFWTGLWLGIGLAIVWVGVPVVWVTLIFARWCGVAEVHRLRMAGRTAFDRPDWTPPTSRAGLFGSFRSVVGDGRYWSHSLHVIVNFALGTATWSLVVIWISAVMAGPVDWLPAGWSAWGWIGGDVSEMLHGWFSAPGHEIARAAFWIGVVITLPLLARGTVLLHDGLARLLLQEREGVRQRKAAEVAEASRESAVLAEDRNLRRLERDIHDGPQQSLLRIQYDLASAARSLDRQAEAAPLVEGALQLTKETLTELRELSRGLAPPVLQDRGLASAIRSLSARSSVPVVQRIDLDGRDEELREIERSVYFVVSELLANCAKHSQATEAWLTLTVVAAEDSPSVLRVDLTDDGIGGAVEIPGHGLDGLRQRLTGLRGALSIDSQLGGPTVIVVDVPVP